MKVREGEVEETCSMNLEVQVQKVPGAEFAESAQIEPSRVDFKITLASFFCPHRICRL